ncbi:MAG TPA: 6-hydroxymethylpterin diphosphokinase MptE-like protein, partial [Rhabdochlamydiaceae bacterium]|nr:6-hydroxymethylpterin diphosphokinase MptE-like protein [Rhabdochlamydiaceae bacterium]
MHSQVKCLYGLPSPDLLLDLKKKNQTLIVIEDAPEAFFTELEDVKIYFLGNDNEEELFKQIAWDFVFIPFEMCEFPGNSSKSIERMKEIFQKLSYFQRGVNLTASDYQERGLDILKNILRNDLPAKKGGDLFGAFKGIPAVICGGGASLEKNMEHLIHLKDKALIFSGGAGLNTLGHFGIKPHFAAGIDPNPSLDRFLSQTAFETSFFYQSRFNFDQLRYFQGERLWIEGSGGFPIEEWLFSSTPFDGGWNVATFLTRLAYELGCNPIILCGVDLASKNEKLYASKVEEQKEEHRVQFKDEMGNIFYSKNDWIMAGQWLSGFAKEHPEVVCINCSEGLKFDGFTAKSLNEIDFSLQRDFEGLVHAKMQGASSIQIPQDQFALLNKSFYKSGQLCEKLIQVMEKYFPHSPQEKGDYILLEMELE